MVTGWPGIAAFVGTIAVAFVKVQCCAANDVCAASHAAVMKLRAVSVVDASVVTLKKSHQRSYIGYGFCAPSDGKQSGESDQAYSADQTSNPCWMLLMGTPSLGRAVKKFSENWSTTSRCRFEPR